VKRERELEPEAPGVANQSTHAPSLFPYLGLPGEYKGASHFQGVTLVLFSLFIIWTSQTPQTLRHLCSWTLLLLDTSSLGLCSYRHYLSPLAASHPLRGLQALNKLAPTKLHGYSVYLSLCVKGELLCFASWTSFVLKLFCCHLIFPWYFLCRVPGLLTHIPRLAPSRFFSFHKSISYPPWLFRQTPALRWLLLARPPLLISLSAALA
jgi:hypothetical protein